jgi:predicted kinase
MMLYIFGGLPGTGKSSLAAALARRRCAVYLRIDTIEQAIRETGITDIGPKGYTVAYDVALDNLRLGFEVVADSVNPIEITRRAWRNVAMQTQCPFVEIEIICSDEQEHRVRVKCRTTDIIGLKLPTWQDVINRGYEPWETEHIVIDTAGRSLEQSIAEMFQVLEI